MTKCQVLKFPVQRTPLHILKQYHVRSALKRPTLSILFPHYCTFSPAQQSDKLSLCQEKQATISFYKTIPATDQAVVPGNRSQNYSTSLATEQSSWLTTKREWCHSSQGPGMETLLCTTMLLRADHNSFGWYTEMANKKHVYITSLTIK